MSSTSRPESTQQESVLQHNTVFAAPADDPRARRPIDAAVLAIGVLVVLLMAWSYRRRSDVDQRVIDFVRDGIPGWISGTATIVFILGGLYGVGLVIGIAIFGRGRRAIVRDMLLAMVTTFVALVALSYLAGPEFPDFIPELLERDGRPSYPVTRLAMSVAIISVVGPFLTVPMRKIGQRLIVSMAFAALIMEYGTVTAVVGGLALGLAAAAAVHLVFGSGRGIPSRDRILAALAEADVAVDDIEYAQHQPTGATIVIGTQPDGTKIHIKVYGRDATDAAFAERLWRTMWFRGSSRTASLTASRTQLAEHETLVMLTLERASAPAPRVITATRALTDDVVLVSELVEGRTFAELNDAEISDALLDEVWSTLEALHRASTAKGELDGSDIVVTPTGVVFADLSAAILVPRGDDVRADRAQLLVASALAVGDDRAIAAARRSLSDDELLATVPLLQTAVLPGELQDEVKRAKYRVKDLRGRVASELGTETPELAQLHRISWGGVAMVALTLFAAYSLITSLTEIGFDTIVDEISNASWGWVVVALAMAQLTNIGEYLSLAGVMGQPIPFGPTMMFRYAISFISLAVPSDAGAIAMNVRYQQKLGVPPAAAVAQGPLLTIVSKSFDVILLLITAQFVSSNVDFGDVDFGPVVKLVGLVIVLALIGISVVVAVPRWRRLVAPHLREGFDAVKGSLTDPDRLTKVIGGTLLQKVLFAMTLGASVAAYGSHLPFASAIFVNTAVSLFVGLMPVPGGIGVGEAALTAGLIAVGIPEEVAVAAAITHRMCTAYLPPVFGWWASRWLTERDYL
jgi:uncharacterized membrane protein YbhN (UPF0104 family)